MVRCDEFEDRLNELLDDRRAPPQDAQLAAHALLCPACAAQLHGCELLLDGIAHLGRIIPPVDLASRVVPQWQAAAPRDEVRLHSLPRRTRRRLAYATAAIAATALFAMLSGVLWQRADRTDDALLAQVEADIQAPPARDSLRAKQQQVALIELAAETYRPLIVETRESLQNALDWLPLAPPERNQAPRATSAGNLELASAATETAEHLLLDGPIPGGIAPVTQSAMRSVAVLLRVLPSGSQPVHQ